MNLLMPAMLLVAAMLAGAVHAGDLTAPPPPPDMPKTMRMQSILWDAEKWAAGQVGQPVDMLREQFAGWKIGIDDQMRVHVEIIGQPDGPPLAAVFVDRVGGIVTNTWMERVEAWVPVNRLITLANLLPEGYFMERAGPINHDAVGGQGAVTINSDSYRDGGANGAGRIIAVIDGGYQSLTAARNAADAPTVANTTQVNYTPNTFESDGAHGTGCVEAAFDHCPGATWRLYKIDSHTDVGTAVTNAAAAGVDIITHSLSWYNQGWSDNTGAACAAANDATANGMLFFTSAGNRAESHYRGVFSDTDADNWHNFSGGDELMNITTVTGSDTYYLMWSNTSVDLDFYLYNAAGDTVLASSTNGGGTFEQFSYNAPSSQSLRLAVRRASGSANPTFQIFIHNGPVINEYGSAAGSTTSPSNSTSANVISNGAVTHTLHASGNGTTGIIASYSSQGPTNSGATRPDLTGPTNTTTTSNGAFGGTSCATPNNAGAACAFWSSVPGYSNSAIRWLLYEQARLWKDWGSAGIDNVYGHGGTILTDHVTNTRWLARGYGNTLNATTGPFYTAQAAYDGVPNGGRVLIFPGGTYPETASMLGTKSLLIDSKGGTAVLGN